MSIPGSASPLFFQTAAGAAAGFSLQKSVRFNNGDSPYLNRTPSSASNRRTFTWAGWVKRGAISSSASRTIFSAGSGGFNVDLFVFYGHRLQILSAISSINWNYVTTALFRDPSAWYHITVAVDTTNSTASDRVKIYINGTRITEFDTSVAPSQNYENNINSTNQHAVSYDTGNIGYYFDGYMADVYFIDGQQLDPTSFGEFDANGVWQAKDASSLTFGTNGFHLFDFANESGIGNDSSGNDNDFSVNNISSSAGVGNDVLFDVPTNGSQSDTGAGGEVSGNYATLNPLETGTNTSLANGNLEFSNSAAEWNSCLSTIFVSSGKWYCEALVGNAAANGFAWGVAQNGHNTDIYLGVSGDSKGWALYGNTSNSYTFHTATVDSSYCTLANSDTLGMALDMDNGTLTYYVNGTSQGTAFTGITGSVCFAVTAYTTGHVTKLNFGQRAFAYSAPSGYKALCTANLPTATVPDGSTVFDIDLWTGTGSTLERSNFSFNPDLVWIKNRSATYSHLLFDSVRGATKYIKSNTTAYEQTNSSTLSSFDSDGFTLGGDNEINRSSYTYVAWAWDAGSSTVSNTDGSITSSVRANQAAGFSIVQWTGTSSAATIGHGLNASLGMYIIKNTDDNNTNWAVYHKTVGATKKLLLNTTDAPSTSSFFNSTEPTSSVFSVGGSGTVNNSGDEMIAYCFAPVAGYSAFGTYTGGSGNQFVYTGFRPALVAVRRYDTGSSGTWVVCDSARDLSNAVVPFLSWNSNGAEVNSADRFDFLSNGFKLRAPSNYNPNESGADYLYFAIAENPFQANGGLAR